MYIINILTSIFHYYLDTLEEIHKETNIKLINSKMSSKLFAKIIYIIYTKYIYIYIYIYI